MSIGAGGWLGCLAAIWAWIWLGRRSPGRSWCGTGAAYLALVLDLPLLSVIQATLLRSSALTGVAGAERTQVLSAHRHAVCDPLVAAIVAGAGVAWVLIRLIRTEEAPPSVGRGERVVAAMLAFGTAAAWLSVGAATLAGLLSARWIATQLELAGLLFSWTAIVLALSWGSWRVAVGVLGR